MMRGARSRLFWPLLSTLLAGCVASVPPTDKGASGPTFTVKADEKWVPGNRHLTLMHTNDIHAAFAPEPATWRDDKAPVGGFEMLDAAVRRVRTAHPDALLVDAGDVMTGNPISTVAVDGLRGWPLFDLMNQVGYSAWTLGNHDFDAGQQNLLNILPRLKFPTVSTNLTTADHTPIDKYVLPSVILRSGDVKVGVVGLITPELSRLVAKSSINGLTVLPPIEALRAKVKELDARTDLVVVLSHCGESIDTEVATAIPEIDVIVGGHTHQRIHPPMKVGTTLIVQAGSNLKYLGLLDLELANHQVTGVTSELIPLLVTPEARASAPVAEAMARAHGLVDAEFKRNVGGLTTPWKREYYAESNIGDWITDQLRSRAVADVGFLNSGGIRRDLPAGTVSKGDLLSILPFDSQLCTFKVTGEQLRRILQADVEASIAKSHGSLQVSGVRYSWKREGDKVRVLEVTVNGAKLEPERIYVIATTDFLLYSQPEKYFPGVEPQEPLRLNVTLVDVIEQAMESARQVESRLDGRIVELGAE